MLTTAPSSRPPALPPVAKSRPGVVRPAATRCSAQAMKSVKVFFLLRSLPPSYHRRPSSSPPRTWAMAKVNPRSSRLSRDDRKVGSMLMP